MVRIKAFPAEMQFSAARTRIAGLMAAVFVCMIGVASAESARKAASALPDRYRSKIVRISADNGAPDPPQWYFVSRATHSADGILSITVRNGKIVQQKTSLDLRVLLGDFTPINLSQVLVDSRGAYDIAKRYVAARNRKLGSASFLLDQKGEGASPIWSVWCYDPDTRYIGLMKVLASTGDVIFWE